MDHVMTVFGTTLMIIVSWFTGLFSAPYIVEKMFPKWSIHRKAATGVVTYLFLTGLVLVLFGKFI